MNRLFVGAWIAPFALGMGLGLSACGGSPCDDLEDRCSECSATQQVSCRAAAEGGRRGGSQGEDACQTIVDNFTCAAFGG